MRKTTPRRLRRKFRPKKFKKRGYLLLLALTFYKDMVIDDLVVTPWAPAPKRTPNRMKIKQIKFDAGGGSVLSYRYDRKTKSNHKCHDEGTERTSSSLDT